MRRAILLLTLAFSLLSIGGREAFADESAANAAEVRTAIDRGLKFLEEDAAKWRKERQCSTCHHGTMTAWALSEARAHGRQVSDATWTDTLDWTKKRILERVDLPRDTRPGFNMVNTPAIYLILMSQAVPGHPVISSDEQKRIADHLIKHQEADGSWSWGAAPAKNRPPPYFESDEVATRLASLALLPLVPANGEEASPIRDSVQKAESWLQKTPPSDSNQAAAIRLVMASQKKESADSVRMQTEQLLKRQNSDGGWGQLRDMPSDAYATGQSLYILNLIGISNDRPEMQRGIHFLVRTQKADGSWTMNPRCHPEATPAKFTVPIIYFGSAWGTLGLLRCGSPPST